jgi:hypothetical protein
MIELTSGSFNASFGYAKNESRYLLVFSATTRLKLSGPLRPSMTTLRKTPRHSLLRIDPAVPRGSKGWNECQRPASIPECLEKPEFG